MLSASASGAADRLAQIVTRDPTLWEQWGTPFAIGVAVALVGAMLFTFVVVTRRRHDSLEFGPECRRFCRAVGLSARERRTLNRLAHLAGLPGAVTLLASRGALDHAVRIGADSLSAGDVRRVESIRVRVNDSNG